MTLLTGTWHAPLIALVGRPNVGKSTLFNRLLGRRSAIVHDEPGVTRDRHYGQAEFGRHPVRLVDTGGFAPGDQEGMLPLMREQAQIAIAEADVIVFIGNARDGVTAVDEEIADVLRRTKKPVLVCANKCDADTIDVEAMAFYSLGFDTVLPIAAEHNRGVLDLIEAIVEALQEGGAFEGEQRSDPVYAEAEDGDVDANAGSEPIRGGRVDRVRVCFVGRPNVGKSTLVNKLLGSERCITADQPGTTRDAIDIEFTWKGEPFTLVDTAGLRRKRSITQQVEQYAVSQAVRAIERSHVAVLVLDATQSLADQDAKVAALVQDRGRACVVAVNKWDLVEKETMTQKGYEIAIVEQMPFLAHVPLVFLSARTGQRVDRLFEMVETVYANFNRHVGTGEFNRWLGKLQEAHQPPTYRGRRLRMYYGNQIALRPPQFAIQVNTLGAISPSYERFLIAQMREQWEFLGTPVRIRLKKKPARTPKIGSGMPVPAMAGAGEMWQEADAGDFGPDDEEFQGDAAGEDDDDDGDETVRDTGDGVRKAGKVAADAGDDDEF